VLQPRLRQADGYALLNPSNSVYLGNAAHIKAKHSPLHRFDAKLSPADCGAVTNGVHLCLMCHTLVDSEDEYTLYPLRLHAERRTQNAERRTQNAERRTQNAERQQQTRTVSVSLQPDVSTQNAYSSTESQRQPAA
jgi:hypothetical protein